MKMSRICASSTIRHCEAVGGEALANFDSDCILKRPSDLTTESLIGSTPCYKLTTTALFLHTILPSYYLQGVTTLTNAVSGQSQNCSGNLEIFPGIGTLRNFPRKHAIIPGHYRKKSGHQRRCISEIREDDPNVRDD